jgi:hypothetical protein
MTQRLRGWVIGAVLIVAGVLVGYALPQSTVSPKAEIGTVMKVNGAIGGKDSTLVFKTTGQHGTVRYPMQDPIPWQGTSNGGWHYTGEPPCLVPGSSTPVKATLGVISVHAEGSAPGGPMIVWVKCYG